jgi:hypothetical protein
MVLLPMQRFGRFYGYSGELGGSRTRALRDRLTPRMMAPPSRRRSCLYGKGARRAHVYDDEGRAVAVYGRHGADGKVAPS